MTDFRHEPILVTGAARSATSMIAGIVHACGAWGGRLSGPNRYNKRGMFENSDIRNTVVKPFLVSIGADKMGQNPLPDIDLCRKIAAVKGPEIRRAVLKIVDGQRYSGNLRWFYKGAKMCLFWPVWHAAFPKATWVIVRRPDEDVVSSCVTTDFMRKRNGRTGWQDWLNEHKERFAEMQTEDLDVTEVWSNEVVRGDFGDIRRVVEKARLSWNGDAVKEFVDPALYVHDQGGGVRA